jgi:hypothetical protein
LNWNRDITKPLLVTSGLGLLACLAALAIFIARTPAPHGRDARKAEGEQLMGAARDACRIAYAKHDSIEAARARLAQAKEEFGGEYYYVSPTLVRIDEKTWRVDCIPTGGTGPSGYLTFRWDTGNSEYGWSDEVGK